MFEKLNVCSSHETESRTNVVVTTYKETVNIELNTFLLIAEKHILPSGFLQLQRMKGDYHSDILDREFTSFKESFENLLEAVQ